MLTSTGSSLFSTEALPDLPPASPAPTHSASVALTAPSLEESSSSFTPKLRSSIRLDSRLAADLLWDRPGEQIAELAIGGRLELEAELSPHLEAFVAPNFTEVVGLDRDGHDRELLYLEVPEAQVSWSRGPFRLRAGALIFSWGASDLVAPSDVLNPVDLRRGAVGSPEELKIPVLAAEAVLSLGKLTIHGVLEPTFNASRFFLSGWDSSLSLLAAGQGLLLPSLDAFLGAPTLDRLGDQILINRRPTDRPDQGTIAARATLRLGDLDLSATAVRGWDTFPAISINPALVAAGGKILDSLANGTPLDPFDPAFTTGLDALRQAAAQHQSLFVGEYRRKTVLGIDASWALDPFVLKMDLAYTPSRVLYTQTFEPVMQPWLNAVVGAEYNAGERLSVIVEAFTLVAFDLRSFYRLMLLEPRSAPPSTVDTGVTRTIAFPGVSGVVRYSVLAGDLVFELAGVATFPRGDLLGFPTVRYRLDDHQELRVGAVLLGGPPDSYGGSYKSNNEAFVGYRWMY